LKIWYNEIGDSMKKIVIIIFLFVILCGCESKETKGKYDTYERVDFVGANANRRVFNTDVYAVVDITEETVMVGPGEENALVYQIGPNEWILLDKIESGGMGSSSIHNDSSYTYFYYDKEKKENKLFILRSFGTALLEYTLKEEKFEKKELKFDTSSIVEKSSDDFLEMLKIEKVEDSAIYYQASTHNTREDFFVKCSLENYVCELEKME